VLTRRADVAVAAGAHSVHAAVRANLIAGDAARTERSAAAQRRRNAGLGRAAAAGRAGNRIANTPAGKTALLTIDARRRAAASAAPVRRAVVRQVGSAGETAASAGAALGHGRLNAAAAVAASSGTRDAIAEAAAIDAALAGRARWIDSAAARPVCVAGVGGQCGARAAGGAVVAADAWTTIGGTATGDHQQACRSKAASAAGRWRAVAAATVAAGLAARAALAAETSLAAFGVEVAGATGLPIG